MRAISLQADMAGMMTASERHFSCWPASVWDCQPLAGLADPKLGDLATWTLFWAALYGCLHLALPKERPDWISRIESSLHACVALVRLSISAFSEKIHVLSFAQILAGRCIFIEDERHPLDPTRLHELNTPLQNLTLVISCGYL